MIESFRVVSAFPDIERELVATEHMVSDPTTTTSWILPWCKTTDAPTVLVVGVDGEVRTRLVLPLERVSMKRVPVLRTVTFRQGPFGPMRTTDPVIELLDHRARRILASALGAAGHRVPSVLLFDVRGPAPDSDRSPLVVLQDKMVATAPIPRGDDPGRDFVGSSKAARELRRHRRRMAEDLGHGVETTLAEPGERIRSAIGHLITRKRELSADRASGSELWNPNLRDYLLALADEANDRGDLKVLVGLLGGPDQSLLAANLLVEAGNEVHGLIQCYEPDYGRFSPGRVLLHDVVEHIARAGSSGVVNFGKAEGELPRFATDSEIIHDLALPLIPGSDRLAGPARRLAAAVRGRTSSAAKAEGSGETARVEAPAG